MSRIPCPVHEAEEDGEDTWTVTVQIPARLPDAVKDSLFTAIADAVHAWVPSDRDGWDPQVTGHPTPQETP